MYHSSSAPICALNNGLLSLQDTYVDAERQASFPSAKCAAIRELARCIADLGLEPTNPLTSEVEAFRDVVIFKNQNCADLDQGRVPVAPRATSLEDVLTFTVDQLKDIRFVHPQSHYCRY